MSFGHQIRCLSYLITSDEWVRVFFSILCHQVSFAVVSCYGRFGFCKNHNGFGKLSQLVISNSYRTTSLPLMLQIGLKLCPEHKFFLFFLNLLLRGHLVHGQLQQTASWADRWGKQQACYHTHLGLVDLVTVVVVMVTCLRVIRCNHLDKSNARWQQEETEVPTE